MYQIQDGLPKYVVNFDELTQPLKDDLLELINDKLKDNYPDINTNNLESTLEDIRSRLPHTLYLELKTKIDVLIYKKVMGVQKIEGALLDIPPIIKTTKHDFIFDKDVFLTGFHLDQTGWKKQDKYTLEINKNKIIAYSATKEIGEHKYFNTFFKVIANTPISFLLDNNSGNSRQTIIDLEFIEGEEITVIPPHPPDPPIPDPPSIEEYWIKQIPNEWDVAVVMNWESGPCDVDLHGVINIDHVYFAHKVGNDMYLNFDYIGHLNGTNPEILSVKGNKGSTLEVYLHNYTGGVLVDPVSVKIYGKDIAGKPKLLKDFNITLPADRLNLLGVCSINLGTLGITNLNKKIKTISGGI